MSNSNPVFVLVPGAWHTEKAYEPFTQQLKSAGYDVYSWPNASLGPAETDHVSCLDDTNAVRRHLSQLIDDQGLDVVIIAHSYGGMPASAAGHGFSKAARQKAGKAGGVSGLILLAAFTLSGGLSLLDTLGGKPSSFVNFDQLGEMHATTTDSIETFYGDVDRELAEQTVTGLKVQDMYAMSSATTTPLWEEPEQQGRFAYIKCLRDRAAPPFVQDIIVEKSNVKWIIREMNTSHSPFLSKPEELKEVTLELLQQFQTA